MVVDFPQRPQRLVIWLLPSRAVASRRQVDLGIELHAWGIVLQLPHPSEFSYSGEEATVGALLPLEDMLEVGHRRAVFSRQVA